MLSSFVFADDLEELLPFAGLFTSEISQLFFLANFFSTLSVLETPSEIWSGWSWCSLNCVASYVLSSVRSRTPFLNYHHTKIGICNFALPSADLGLAQVAQSDDEIMFMRDDYCNRWSWPTVCSTVSRSRHFRKTSCYDPEHSVVVSSYLLHWGVDWIVANCKEHSIWLSAISIGNLQYISQPDNMRFHEQICRSYFFSLFLTSPMGNKTVESLKSISSICSIYTQSARVIAGPISLLQISIVHSTHRWCLSNLFVHVSNVQAYFLPRILYPLGPDLGESARFNGDRTSCLWH